VPVHDIVAVGASAGGVEALNKLVNALPADFPAALFVVVHIPAESVSVLPQILSRAGPLCATHAENGENIAPGRIYVAPPDRHLLIKAGHVRVVAGPRENRHRPAIDPLFRSAARVYASRVIGVLLTGAGDDGVAGLRAIKNRGGIAIVQDPADAAYPALPRNALDFVDADHVPSLDHMAPLLIRIVREPAPPPATPVSPRLQRETQFAEVDLDTIEDDDKPDRPSAFSCPDCGGVLWEVEGEDLLRFRCRVGHSYTASALADEHDDHAEKALWAAFRNLEEQAHFARRLAARARRAGREHMAERFLARAEEAAANAATIRRVIVQFDPVADTELSRQ
jgi:two-component system chemotaxis response regulator CheB